MQALKMVRDGQRDTERGRVNRDGKGRGDRRYSPNLDGLVPPFYETTSRHAPRRG